MKCAAITLIVLGLLASPQPAASFELNSFSGNPARSRNWSQLCIKKDGNYLLRNGDNPICRLRKDERRRVCLRAPMRAGDDGLHRLLSAVLAVR